MIQAIKQAEQESEEALRLAGQQCKTLITAQLEQEEKHGDLVLKDYQLQRQTSLQALSSQLEAQSNQVRQADEELAAVLCKQAGVNRAEAIRFVIERIVS